MGKIICPECGNECGRTGGKKDTKADQPCYNCQQKKKIPVVDDKTIALCKEHREKLRLPKDHYIGTKEDPWWKCGNGLICYDDCPVPKERDKAYPTPTDDMTDAERSYGVEGRGFTWIDNAGSGNLEAVSDKKPKKFSIEVKDFLWLQSRVLDKLAFHPDIYRMLDKLSSDEIMERLSGKTMLEGVPKQLGGKTEAEYSPETIKYFADLEKKFAKEDDEKKKASK